MNETKRDDEKNLTAQEKRMLNEEWKREEERH